MDIQLFHGDCLEIMKNIPDKSVDLILCDLPYGSTASSWDIIIPFDKLWEQYERLIKDNASIILFSNGLFTAKLMTSNMNLYKYKYTWLKKVPTFFMHAKNRPLVKHEDILVFSKGKMGHANLLENRMKYNPQGLIRIDKKVNGKSESNNYITSRKSHKEYIQEYTNYPTDILENFDETSSKKKLHPNQKPTGLLEFLVKTYTNENETVLDNCMGSGSTGVAAKNLNRRFIGIEKDEKYFNIAKQRIEGTIIKSIEKEENKMLKLPGMWG
mgnify:FL=1